MTLVGGPHDAGEHLLGVGAVAGTMTATDVAGDHRGSDGLFGAPVGGVHPTGPTGRRTSRRIRGPDGRRSGRRRPVGEWNHATRTRASQSRRAVGYREPWHQARTLALAGRYVARPADALTTATARVVPFAYACGDVRHCCSFIGVIGLSATPGACSFSPSLPPEAPSLCRQLPGFNGITGFSAASLSGPTLPSRVVGWRVLHTTGRASRVASTPPAGLPPFHACRRHYPGGAGRCSRRSLPDP